MNKQNTVIHHSADFDGLFCREIARKFLPDAKLIGWDFGDKPIPIASLSGQVYVMDLPLDAPFGLKDDQLTGVGGIPFIWIDHHRTSIASHPTDIPGYRIDGVAACRLAWQWFAERAGVSPYTPNFAGRGVEQSLPSRENFIDRVVGEPYAVRLAGEYDIWDKRDPNAELFQHGLRSQELTPMMWDLLLVPAAIQVDGKMDIGRRAVGALLEAGRSIAYAREQEYKQVILKQGFDAEFEGHRYLACNSHELDIRSQLFEAGIKAEHDGLLGFTWSGKDWRVSLYGITGKDVDHSEIAKKHGGGGHRNACGFRTRTLPFILG